MADNILDEARLEREQQRSESEARDIIHDLHRLYTFPEERKTRWVWELLQNAKDVAGNSGVEIAFKLEPDRLVFSHNGLPFKTKHLLAILYKTSTKALDGEGGTTGKYGTGFVTTHILNKKLSISGVHENDLGKRNFTIEIDRSAASLDESIAIEAMQRSLSETFTSIDKITKAPAEDIIVNWHSFTFILNPDSYVYAERGLQELERNLAFTLLIDSSLTNTNEVSPFKEIKSVSIETASQKTKYIASLEQTKIKEISFMSLGLATGLLYHQKGKLIFGIPAIKENESFKLLPIDGQAVLFKEFPLIGTEDFNLPVFIQHQDFHPTEQRDGIRTKIISETEEDHTANRNRKALVEFVASYIYFIQNTVDAGLSNSHLFAKSGLPSLVENYSNIEWYQENIQKPIREFILQKNIVKSNAGSSVKIAEAKFLINELYGNTEFYSLASNLIPDQLPDSSSVWEWSKIITQDAESWPENITIDVENLIKLIPYKVDVNAETSYDWLKKLYQYLDHSQLSHLGEKNPIYLSEANNFCVRDDVSIHPLIDPEFKIVSKGLGRSLDEEFLNKKLGIVPEIKTFDLTEFYNNLNKELISELKIETATLEQIKAVFHVCCLFRSDRAYRRETWFNLINQLLPDLAQEKKSISVDYDNYWRSAELWSIRYICHLIEKSVTPSAFASSYFEGNNDSCFEWLKMFLEFVFSLKEDNSEVFLKRRIMPTQSNEFKPYDDFIFAQEGTKYFSDSIKDIYKDYTGKGDPRRFIIDNRIAFEGLRTRDVSVLTNEIDKIFHDLNIESKVKKGGSLNGMFLQLNDWFEQFSKIDTLLPSFSTKRASLYVLALGEGFSKQIMEINKSGKSIEDIVELAKIQLSPAQMKLLDDAAAELGAVELLAKAQEMLNAKHQIDRWKKIGTAAEIAFEESIAGLDFEYKIENPDRGKDFDLIINAKGYAIEIKNVVAGKENVRMSILQGRTAVNERDFYALCVMTRPDDEMIIDMEYFKAESRFVIDIGYKIGDKIAKWDEGLQSLEVDADVKVSLVDKTESVYINRNIWKNGISFEAFITELKKILAVNEADR
ncbi:MAG: hypothetical protein JNM95_13725 [Chitinophagaceae bacterium]|nr:hypothetical protein [Chitinophagaceae bacterium]